MKKLNLPSLKHDESPKNNPISLDEYADFLEESYEFDKNTQSKFPDAYRIPFVLKKEKN